MRCLIKKIHNPLTKPSHDYMSGNIILPGVIHQVAPDKSVSWR